MSSFIFTHLHLMVKMLLLFLK